MPIGILSSPAGAFTKASRSMDILVAFKMVPDLDLVTGEMVAGEAMRVETGHLRPIVNPCDEGTLELALGLRDQAEAMNEPLTLAAISVGEDTANRVLKTLLALRFCRAVRVAAAPGDAASPNAVAHMIADFAKANGFCFLMLGYQSADQGSGLVPPLAAAALGWPIVADVLGVRPIGDGTLEVVRRYIGGCLVSRLRPPAVLAVSDAVVNCLRVPTLKDRMTYGKQQIEVFEGNSRRITGSDLEPWPALGGHTAVDDRRNAEMIDGGRSEAAFAALTLLCAGHSGRGL